MKRFLKYPKKMSVMLWKYDAKAILGTMLISAWLGLFSMMTNDVPLMKYMIIFNSVFLAVITPMFVCADSLREYFKEFSFFEQRRYHDLAFIVRSSKFATDYDESRVHAVLVQNKKNKDAFFESMDHFHFTEKNNAKNESQRSH